MRLHAVPTLRRARSWLLAVVPLASVLTVGVGVGVGASHPAAAAPLTAHAYAGGGMIGFGSVNLAAPAMPEPLSSPVLVGAATPDGRGYWLVAADGGVFSFGDAQFYGSTAGIDLNDPIVAMAATSDGKGYWLVAADGGIFTFGDAGYFGSWAADDLPDPVVGLVVGPGGQGYTVATADGVVLALGDAQAYGGLTLNPDATPVSDIIGNGAGTGYWLLDPEAWTYSFRSATTEPTLPDSSAIVAAAASQIEPDPDTGSFCNPYGPCEEWCALFATWAWRQAGVPIPSYAFVGYISSWAASHGVLLPPTATPDPGDAVLYGTGPQNVYTAVHVGIVTQVWPDGAIDTVDGDSGPGRDGWLSVTINGPYLPSDSLSYNGVGIYAFAQP